jgi:hypothetical protein
MFARLPSGRRGRRDARCPSKRESSSKRPRTAWRALRRCGRGVDGMPWFKARSMPIRTCMLGPRSARARCRGNAGSWPSAEARAHGFLPSRIVMLSYGDGECLSLPGDGSALVKRTANVIPSAARASARRANHAPQSPTGVTRPSSPRAKNIQFLFFRNLWLTPAIPPRLQSNYAEE